jgi:hypothetical protein
MQLSVDIHCLLALSGTRLQSCDRELANQRRRLAPIESELQAIELQAEGLRNLLQGSRLQGTTLSHQALLSNLRQQAVVRRQQQQIVLERVRVERHRELLTQELEEQRRKRLLLQQKQQKYQSLESHWQKRWRTERLVLDERETEDHLMSRR